MKSLSKSILLAIVTLIVAFIMVESLRQIIADTVENGKLRARLKLVEEDLSWVNSLVRAKDQTAEVVAEYLKQVVTERNELQFEIAELKSESNELDEVKAELEIAQKALTETVSSRCQN